MNNEETGRGLRADEFDWKRGKVSWWYLDSIDVTRPMTEQLSELDEDLAWIEFPGERSVDIGWYPSH